MEISRGPLEIAGLKVGPAAATIALSICRIDPDGLREVCDRSRKLSLVKVGVAALVIDRDALRLGAIALAGGSAAEKAVPETHDADPFLALPKEPIQAVESRGSLRVDHNSQVPLTPGGLHDKRSSEEQRYYSGH